MQEIDQEIIQRTLEVIQSGEKGDDPTEKTKSTDQKYKRSLADAPQPQTPQFYLSKREINSLKANKYEEAIKRFKKSYVIRNKKTGMIAELRAATPFHACTMIGWKERHCQLLETIDHDKPVEPQMEIVEVPSPNTVPAVEAIPTVVKNETLEIVENPVETPVETQVENGQNGPKKEE